jgi:hypothetical protein
MALGVWGAAFGIIGPVAAEASDEPQAAAGEKAPDDTRAAAAKAPDDAPASGVDAARPRNWPASFDVPAIEGPNGGRLEIGLRMQLRLTTLDGDREREPELTFPRIRPQLDGFFLDDRLWARLQLNVSPGEAEVIDLWLEARLPRGVALRLGQTKVPLTRYRLRAFHRFALVDWPVTTRAFGADRQLGLLAHEQERSTPLFWAFGVFSGVNARASHAVGPRQAYGERERNPSRLADPAPPATVHPELGARIGYEDPGLALDPATDEAGGPLRVAAWASAVWDARPVAGRDYAFRFAPEVLLRFYGVSITAIGYGALFEASERDATRLGALGALFEADVRVSWLASVGLRYGVEARLDALNRDARERAARLTAEDPTRSFDAPGSVAERHELGLGLNLFLVGSDLTLQLDASWLRTSLDEAVGGGETDAARVRAQMSVAL